MRTPDINFRNIRKHRNSQNDGFEELTRQLVLAEPPENYTAIENRGPGADGGVEILVRFSDDRVWGWQSKYFLDGFGASEIAQLKKSFSAALKNFPQLERYYIAIPRNFSGHAEGREDTQTKNWNSFKDWCKKSATKLGRDIAIELWDDSYFVNKLQRNDALYTGMRLYWFDERALDTEWFRQSFEKSLAYIGKRYRPDDHVTVKIADTISILSRDERLATRIASVSQNLSTAINILQILAKRHAEIDTFRSSCEKFIKTLEENLVVLTGIEITDIYSDLLSESLKQISRFRSDNIYYKILIDAQYEKTVRTDPKTGKEDSIYTYESKELRDLFEIISKATSTFSNEEIKLFRIPALLISGDAGIGKSHLLANEVETHQKNDKPAIFIPARVLDHGDRPEQDLLHYLDLGELRFETFLAALHAAALASGHPVLFVIDGINETLHAGGWASGLPSLITQIKRFNRIALCVSIRSSYRELCIRTGLDVVQVSHHGFAGQVGRATKEYLDRNGIERPSAPIFGLSEILYNPLFLSTAVDFMKATGQSSFPRGMDSLATLISFWLKAVEQNLVTRGFDRISLNDGKIPQIMDKLASEMVAAKSEYIAYELANQICEATVNLAPPARQSDRLLHRLIDEGLLIDTPSRETATGKLISFGFQKFSDYFIANNILLNLASPEALAKEVKEGGQYAYLFSQERFHEFAGPRIALFALTPSRFGKELPLIDNLTESLRLSVNEFISSLLWRKGGDVTRETVSLLEKQRQRKGDDGPLIDDTSWFDLLLELAPLPDCQLNASYLKKDLASLPLGERDARWSVYLVGKTESFDDDWSTVQQLIDWAWVAPKSEIEPDKIHQVAIALALMTSTIDRELRDCSTKALASLFVKFPEEIPMLISEFSDWDDSYVRERVLSAAVAGVLYCDDADIIKAVALAADRMVFRKNPVERHAWTRRYAQIIVNHAAYNKVGVDSDLVSRSAPPYLSEPISDWPTLEQIATQHESAGSIFRSVIGFISSSKDLKGPRMAGDFGHYTMSGIDSSFSAAVREGQPPLTREVELKHFWVKVAALGKAARKARTKLIQLSNLQERVRFSGLLKALDQDQSSPGDDNQEQGIDEKASLEEAEASLVELLPPELKQEYERLQPLSTNYEQGIPKFSRLKGQCWVFNRTLELGWQQSRHENIERAYLKYSVGRHDHQIERIGKKYQHISFEELIGYLADYHWYIDWGKEPEILTHLEDFRRADIDTTYLGGSFSKPIESYLPKGIKAPEMVFVPDTPQSNMAWTKTLDDIPNPIDFFIQADAFGNKWCLQQASSRSQNYMKGFESSEPFRSAQYGIELVLVEKTDLLKLKNLTTKGINKESHDIFENSWSSEPLWGQRSFKHQGSQAPFSLECRAANFSFARITENFAPDYGEFDQSGVSGEPSFSTPHPALLAQLKLKPKDGWSRLFVTSDGVPAFCDNPAFLAGITIIRQDLIETFANSRDLKVVWKVWVEKDGGLGTDHYGGRHEQFARNDFIGFFFEEGGSWQGKLIPFRS